MSVFVIVTLVGIKGLIEKPGVLLIEKCKKELPYLYHYRLIIQPRSSIKITAIYLIGINVLVAMPIFLVAERKNPKLVIFCFVYYICYLMCYSVM